MIDEGRHFPYMEGRLVFKHAIERMPEAIDEALAHNKCQLGDVDLFLFHQANLRINQFVAQKLGIPRREDLQQHPEVRELLGRLDPDAAPRVPPGRPGEGRAT